MNRVVRRFIRDELGDGDGWRAAGDGDESWSLVKLRPGDKLTGVGQSALDSSTPFDPVAVTCELAIFIISERFVASAFDRSDVSTSARTLREVVDKEVIGGIEFSETVKRQHHIDLAESSHAVFGLPCDSQDKHGAVYLCFYWRNLVGATHDFRGYYDLLEGC